MLLYILLQDLIKFTSTSHTDYDILQKALSFAQKYLFAADETTEGCQARTSSASVFFCKVYCGLQKEHGDWVKKCMEYEVESSRLTGKLKRTWRKVVQSLSST